MKNLSPNGMKVLKTLHLIFVVMWLGGCATLGLLALLPSNDSQQLLAKLQTSEAVDYDILIPGAFGTVLTGIVYGGWTKWGFFRHTWLTVKWITSIAIIIIGAGFFHPYTLEMIELLKQGAEQQTNQIAINSAILSWCGLQFIALCCLIPISVFKPWRK